MGAKKNTGDGVVFWNLLSYFSNLSRLVSIAALLDTIELFVSHDYDMKYAVHMYILFVITVYTYWIENILLVLSHNILDSFK